MKFVKKVVKYIFSHLGYIVIRAPNIKKNSALGHGQHHIDFVEDDKFSVEFVHQSLGGDQYFVPKFALHRPVPIDILSGTLFESHTHDFVREVFKPFKGSMVHAGAFFGDMLPNFSRFVSGKVFTFEPVLESYVLAKLCVDRNNLENVILMHAALSAGVGNLHIDTNEGDGRHAGGASTLSDEGSICAAISIDCLNIEDLLLIHLDVEGHELPALKGAQETIKKCRPIIAIEDNKNNCTNFLSDLEYEKSGDIPGLTIWTPRENIKYKEKAKSLIDSSNHLIHKAEQTKIGADLAL